MLPGCAEILQSVELKINSRDETKQDEFNVVERTLTLKETIKSNQSPYPRRIQTQGSGEKARHISENEALLSTFPRTNEKAKYKIGRGDILSFVKLVDNIEENALKKNRWPAIVDNEPYKLGIGDGLALTQIIETENSKIESLNAANIFVSLSDNIQETFGLTVIEAMAAELPCVVTDWNGYKDLVKDNETGYLIPTKYAGEGDKEINDVDIDYNIEKINFDYMIGLKSMKTVIDEQLLISKLTLLRISIFSKKLLAIIIASTSLKNTFSSNNSIPT